MKRIERMNICRWPYRLAVALRVREDQEVEVGPEKTHKEHDLTTDEQGHPVTKPQPHDGAVCARSARLPHHIAPPEEHGRDHGQNTEAQDHVTSIMSRKD